jgi:hypothetical protein
MRDGHPLKEILVASRSQWDRSEIRPAVRRSFARMIDCKTAALGAEIYASETERKVVPHTCKSKSCPSCGHRATELWQREQWRILPDIPYAGICLTMPDVLWAIFRQNRHLLHDLAALGAAAIEQWLKARYGVRAFIMIVPHTFGRHLTFNAHLHVLMSAGGLRELDSRWISLLHLDKRDKEALMHLWRYAVITHLREALKANVLKADCHPKHMRAKLTTQYERWWNIDVARFQSKAQFLRYAGRYVRRPPIAQRRFLKITDKEVEFWTKDLRQKRRVTTWYSKEEFVALLAEHVPDRYQHAIRHFGLLAPRSRAETMAAVFVLLGQEKRLRPRRLSWRNSLRKHFGVDPLIDRSGQTMHWVGRIKP